MPWKVLVSARTVDEVGQQALDLLRDSGCELEIPPGPRPLTSDSLLQLLKGHHAALAGLDQFDANVINSPGASDLQIISRWGVGYDSIDVPAATRNGIVVSFTPGLLNNAVADFTFALLLALARGVHRGHTVLNAGQWTPIWGRDVYGKTLGILGCGRIGRSVARRATGFEMRVIGHDINHDPAAEADGVRFVSFEELLAESDFLSLHAALTPENVGLMGAAALRQMKPTAYLINTARGSLVDENALVRALTEGWIAGAALDAFTVEPLPKGHPLLAAPNALLTPHLASYARETGEKVSHTAAQAIVDLKNGRKPKLVVNPEVFESPVLRARISSANAD